jgi:predicted TIM-barrel fold metal-dependent hydrolase
MKGCGVDKSIVMPNVSSVVSSYDLNLEFIDRYIVSQVKQDFYPLILIDHNDLRTIDQMMVYIGAIHGVKYHPSIAEMPVSYSKMHPILEMAEQLQLPVLVHCGRHWRSRIQFVLAAASKFRHVKFIAAHLGGSATDIIEKAFKVLRALKTRDNVYLDTSAGKLPWLIEQAVNVVGEDRVLFGSDEPYSDLRIGIQCVDLCRFSDDVKEKIFYKNLESVYENIVTKP